MSLTSKSWIVVCISDTHQRHRQLTDRLKSSHSGDILIHAGDITNFGRGLKPFDDFDQWLSELPFKDKLIIGGNHDSISPPTLNHGRFLKNEQVIIDDCLRIYGSSWRPRGESTWLDIPSNSHIIITHNPPYSENGSHADLEVNLQLRLYQIKPLLSVFGHIHADYGVWKQSDGIVFANAASSPSDSRSHTLNDPLRFKISIDENSVISIEHLI
jgi:Icc-related predicted phosphoesterase